MAQGRGRQADEGAEPGAAAARVGARLGRSRPLRAVVQQGVTGRGALREAARVVAGGQRLAAGSAEWQWRQRCGDPHSVGVPGGKAEGTQVHLNRTECPADTDGGPTEEILEIVGRAYPLRSPGELTELASDPATGARLPHNTEA